MSKPRLEFQDKFLPDQLEHMTHFAGSVEQYWPALFAAICRSSGIADPYHQFDLAVSDLYTVEEMGSNPILLHFLQFMIKLGKRRRILEIGTFIGVSAMNFARVLPPDGEVVTIEKFNQFADVARENFRRNGLADRIALLCGDAREIVAGLPRDRFFDMVFIDGDKEHYLDYFHMIDSLVPQGGLVVIDDVFFHGDAINEQPKTDKGMGVQRFMTAAETLTNYCRIALPISNGTMIMLKESAG